MSKPADLRILHADERLIVVDKPAGLLSVPGRGEAKQDCASARLQARYGDALIVHRLDQATSGLLLFARGAQAQRELSADFAERRVDKRYEAVVSGTLEGAGLIDLPLAADWPNRPRQQVDQLHGKPSQTRWEALGPAGPGTRVALQPITGRSHQLRVHLAALGHPILGDTLYAPPEMQALAPRLLLHACALHLPHLGLSFLSPPEF
ncbi:MAG: RNA pseudouridine synthase [Roseateles depolymerans]|uniref:Dual-specificity RNA pseudouridine synthase RluA n=1 Tax=Roseateles depolymerans TaxID=76731 RepID=A0A2W5DF83_9BURK|nr:MAG: RNA pseudouridine synthase [Roseateles depolymerans]